MAGSERQRNCSQSSLILVYWALFASTNISDIIGFYGNVTNSQLCNVRFLFYQQKAMLILSNNSHLTEQEQGQALLAIQRQRMKVILGLQAKVVQCRILDHNHGRPEQIHLTFTLIWHALQSGLPTKFEVHRFFFFHLWVMPPKRTTIVWWFQGTQNDFKWYKYGNSKTSQLKIVAKLLTCFNITCYYFF